MKIITFISVQRVIECVIRIVERVLIERRNLIERYGEGFNGAACTQQPCNGADQNVEFVGVQN
jgi:hypothetical protein